MAFHQLQTRSSMIFMFPKAGKSNVLAFSLIQNARKIATSTRSGSLNALSLTRSIPMRSIPATAILGLAAVSLIPNNSSSCEGLLVDCANVNDPTNGKSGPKKIEPKLNNDEYLDYLLGKSSEITLAGALGFCSGYAVKQAGKALAVIIGGLFIVSQIASSRGYVEIDWAKVEKDVVKAVDPDGDGKITSNDLKIYYKKFMILLKHQLPSTAGFGAGFLFGVTM